MHEHSIARRLLRLVASVCAERSLENVTAIQVEIGELSGIEPDLLQSAFTSESQGTPLSNVRLDITTIPLAGTCNDCQAEQRIHDFDFHCPTCGQPLQAIRGEHLELTSVTTTTNESKPVTQP